MKLKAGAAVDGAGAAEKNVGAGAEVAGAPAKEIVGGVAKKLGAGFVVVVGAAGAGAPPNENSDAAGAAVVVGLPKENNEVGAAAAAGAGPAAAGGVENNESDGVELAGLEKEKVGCAEKGLGGAAVVVIGFVDGAPKLKSDDGAPEAIVDQYEGNEEDI